MIKVLAAVFLVTAIGVNVTFAATDDADASKLREKKCPQLQASTVFIADKTGSRQGGSAKKLSESHKTAESQGWNFDEMSIYIEDGDLQGFFVTYTRTHPCNNK
jgi:hypothetical protein